MLAFAKTDVGKVREMNQDYYYIAPDDEKIKLFILADGMGGYNGGEIASKVATTVVKEEITNKFDKVEKDGEHILDLIKYSIDCANEKVSELGQKSEDLSQMGTTLEVCLIYNDKAYIAHIGDSGIYRIAKNEIKKVTIDHSYVEQLVQDGKITREEARNHPKKNMITRALGCGVEAEPDLMELPLRKDDIIIMCSDGLSNMLQEDEILDIVGKDVKNANQMLVEEANRHGGYDNISVVIIQNN